MSLSALPIVSIAAALGIAGLAGLVRGFAGFGSALVMTPVLSALTSPAIAVPAGLTLEIMLTIPFWPQAVKRVNWRQIALLSITAAFGIPLGTYLLLKGDVALLRYIMSGTVLLAVAILAFGWRYRQRPHPALTAVTGSLSGVLNGAVGMAGPPVIFYFLSGEDKAGTIRASLLIYFTLIDVIAIGSLLLQGLDVIPLAEPVVFLMVPFLGCAYIGAKLFQKSKEETYRRIALGILTCVAISSLFI